MDAENGNASAMYNLAVLYMHKEKNIVEAKKWYEMAAENG